MPSNVKVLKTDWEVSRVASFMPVSNACDSFRLLGLTHETANNMHRGNNFHGVLHSRRLESADEGKKLVSGCTYDNKGISLVLRYGLQTIHGQPSTTNFFVSA
jgi:hypothetical protein